MTTDHAFLAPSSAHRWVRCPASPDMEAQYPEQGDQEAARLGTAAHWVMEQFLTGNVMVEIGAVTPNGVMVTQEMLEGAELIFNDVARRLRPRTKLCVEQRVAIPTVHAQNWGTPDVHAWDSHDLYIWDYKFGHEQVEVFENWQLMDYAAGCIHASDIELALIKVTMIVVQPRAYHKGGPVRAWERSALELNPYIHTLAMAADEATSASLPPRAKPTPDGCKHCTARHACMALQRAAYQGVALAETAQASELPPDALGLEMRLLTEASKLIEARLSGLETQALALMRQAVTVPHWVLRPGTSRTVWNKPDDEILALGAMMGLDLAKPKEAITPAQATKAGLDATLTAAYSFKPQGAMKLTLDDGSDARHTFT